VTPSIPANTFVLYSALNVRDHFDITIVAGAREPSFWKGQLPSAN